MFLFLDTLLVFYRKNHLLSFLSQAFVSRSRPFFSFHSTLKKSRLWRFNIDSDATREYVSNISNIFAGTSRNWLVRKLWKNEATAKKKSSWTFSLTVKSWRVASFAFILVDTIRKLDSGRGRDSSSQRVTFSHPSHKQIPGQSNIFFFILLRMGDTRFSLLNSNWEDCALQISGRFVVRLWWKCQRDEWKEEEEEIRKINL